MKPHLTLILGGARSGKSRFALGLNPSPGPGSVFLATGTPGDDEMRERIQKHRQERPAGWETRESPYDLGGALAASASAPGSVVLVDCLTLWLSNLLCGVGGDALGKDAVEEKIAALQKSLGALQGRVLFVSNEVGWGLVPDSPLGRDFRDLQGRLNQSIAEVSDDIFLLVAGIAQKIK
ncbi:MAG TPA: bifunctional adenosylcobinamide kinase/adenosylcobinamide-phosphate guanylyltransferase [bacterium]|nr:bifunctional adenosylcobinamide kinase/adenosylcobinamide-phosphate guanylyltransferase [bacterium]